MKRSAFFGLASVLLVLARSSAQVPFATTPDWQSSDAAGRSTGAAWADINQDGWLDLVVADGNDMDRQHVKVYLNPGNGGSLPPVPDWQSEDVDYHAHLAVGDVNKDGYPDVAVSVYLGARGFSEKGRIKLYMNRNGVLEFTPSWVSRDSFYTFSCAFGDANGDGYPDLAVACGEAYNSRLERSRIYYNRNGVLDSLPGWMSSDASCSYDVGWADFDNDGRLDLVFANERAPNRMYRNYGDSIGTVASWVSTDTSLFANSLTIADVNNDGYLDLAISDNNQLGGTGRFKIYLNSAGALNTMPWWTSSWSGNGSGIAFADINNDGTKDLLTGMWWGPCRIYLNRNGTFHQVPDWTSATGSVVETIVVGDYDNNGLDTINVRFTGNGTRKLYYLPRAPLQRIMSVTWNGNPASVAAYCYDLRNGWLSFASPASPGVPIDIRVVTSHSLDFAVSNWDNTLGNYVFKNLLPHWVTISVSPSSVDFGPVELGHLSDTAEVSIQNVGPDTLIVSAISNAQPAFHLVNVPALPLRIPSLAVAGCGAVAQPPGCGIWRDTITVVSINPDNPPAKVALRAKCVVVGRARPGVMYAASGPQGELYTINMATGAATPIGSTGIQEVDGLTVRPANCELLGSLASSASTDIYRICEAYGDALPAFHLPVANMRAIAFGPADQMYGGTTTGRLYRINAATGDTVFIGSSGIAFSGLSFNPTSGELWASVRSPITNRDKIYKVDTATGAATLVGRTGDNAITPSIAFDPLGILYGLKGSSTQTNTLIRIDTATGGGTTIGSMGVTGLLAITMRTDSLATGVAENDAPDAPPAFVLHQNYPNPFNPTSQVRFEIGGVSCVSLRVYDLLGREVAALVDGVMKPGTYVVTLDGSRLASGIYFYRLEAGPFTSVKKLVLLR